MNKIGIDFGTSFCTASWINPATHKPEAITFLDCGQKMPTVAYYKKDETVIGQAAYNYLEDSLNMTDDAERTKVLSTMVMSIKRKMQRNQQFHFHDKIVTHEDVIADILKKIKKEVESLCFHGNAVTDVVITHPVVFEQWQKDMLIEAAQKAGFGKIDLLEEPVAAAMGYMESTGEKSNGMLVYDFGGGTFDVAFVKREENGEFRVPVFPEGDSRCGGDDIDTLLYDELESLAMTKYNVGLSSDARYIDMMMMMRCRKKKENMTTMTESNFNEMLPGFRRLSMKLSREHFDELITPVVEKTLKKTRRLMEKIQEAGYAIDSVVMIGGSSRIPLVYQRLQEISPLRPRQVMVVDVAVALGAALYGRSEKSSLKRDCFCIHAGCGKKINSEMKFCIYCGKANYSYNK